MTDWDAYRVFLAVAEKRSFSAAARVLGSSQPTVGRAVAGLEASLGTPLFARTARGLVPTPEAERILDDVRRMSDAARDAERRASGSTRELEGVVRISTSEGVGTTWLLHELHALRAAHPGLRIELVLSGAAVDLARREADIALRLFRPSEPDLVIRRAGKVRFGLFASPAYLARAGTPRRLADLPRHDFAGFPQRAGLPAPASWLARRVPDARFVVTTTSLLGQYEAARAGLGLVLGAAALLEADRALRRVLPRVTPPHLDLYLTAHADVRRSPRVAVVYDWLDATLARSALRP